MRRSGFSLERVLAYRRLREEQKLGQLAAAYRLRHQGEALLKAFRQQLELEQEEITKGVLDLEEWQHRETRLAGLTEQLLAQQQIVARLQAEERLMEEQAVTARQEREILDRLKDKQMEMARYEEGRWEQQQGDELALLRYGRG